MIHVEREEVSREQLLLQAESAGRLADPLERRRTVSLLIQDRLRAERPLCTEAEIFEATGDPSGRIHWASWMAEPISVESFVSVMAIHSASSLDEVVAKRKTLIDRLIKAVWAGGAFFSGWVVTTDEKWREYFFAHRLNPGILDDVVVEPRAAISWLEKNPLATDLLPASLMAYLGGGAQIATAHETTAAPSNHDVTAAPLRPRAKKGPRESGSGRHVGADRRLFPEIARLIDKEGETHYSATRRLLDRIEGADHADDESRIRRVAKRFKREIIDRPNGRPDDGPSIK
jgi:hypothetical protein